MCRTPVSKSRYLSYEYPKVVSWPERQPEFTDEGGVQTTLPIWPEP